jgi:hypothetical protein
MSYSFRRSSSDCALAALSLIFVLSLAAGCSSSGGASVTPDPLDGESVVRCNMMDEQACREYRIVQQDGAHWAPDLSEARELCSEGRSQTGVAGTFEAGACPTDAALARCSQNFGYIAIDYYYDGFADTETLDDPLAPIATACSNAQGTLERAPFIGDVSARCVRPNDGTCREYRISGSQAALTQPDFDSARAWCQMALSDTGTRGTFESGTCAADGALARCQEPANDDEGYTTLDYYYEGSWDPSEEDPLASLQTSCSDAGGSFETAPFP